MTDSAQQGWPGDESAFWLCRKLCCTGCACAGLSRHGRSGASHSTDSLWCRIGLRRGRLACLEESVTDRLLPELCHRGCVMVCSPCGTLPTTRTHAEASGEGVTSDEKSQRTVAPRQMRFVWLLSHWRPDQEAPRRATVDCRP